MKKRLKGASTWLSAFFHPHASGCGAPWHGLRLSPPKPAMPVNRFSEEEQCLKKIGQIFIIGKAPIQILEKYPRMTEPVEEQIRIYIGAFLNLRSAGSQKLKS